MCGGKGDRLPQLAAELLRLKVDIILVSGGDQWIRAAKNATKTIPIVMMGAGSDPIGAGLIESLGRPGGNVTGVTNLTGELGGKRLELLKEAVPKLARVAVLYDPAIRASVFDVKDVLPAAARALRLTIQPWEIRAADGFEGICCAKQGRPDGLYVSPGPLTLANRKRIADSSLKSRLPSMYVRREFVDAGGLMSYGADPLEMRKLGWIEGKNITIEYRFAEQKNERLPELATDLVRLKVDLIVVSSAVPALAAKKATTTIPIVMTSIGDPVSAGLVASLARPGGNVTGFSGLSSGLSTKRLDSRTQSPSSPELDFCGRSEPVYQETSN